MVRRPKDLGTLIIITMVTVLVWFWAATATRDQSTITLQLHFIPPTNNTSFLVDPPFAPVSVTLEGPHLALENAFNRAQNILDVRLNNVIIPESDDPNAPVPILLDIVKILQHHKQILEMGVTVGHCQPPVLTLSLDEQRQVELPINPILPRDMRLEVLDIEPALASVTMPRSLWEKQKGKLEATIVVEDGRLDGYIPGGPYHLDSSIQLPDELKEQVNTNLQTRSATLTFNIQSQIIEYTLETVRVQIVIPPENTGEFKILLEPKTLEKVTVRGDRDLIKRIEAGAVVRAVVKLSYEECENGIEKKPVSIFIAEREDGTVQQIEATVEGTSESDDLMINFTITPIKNE